MLIGFSGETCRCSCHTHRFCPHHWYIQLCRPYGMGTAPTNFPLPIGVLGLGLVAKPREQITCVVASRLVDLPLTRALKPGTDQWARGRVQRGESRVLGVGAESGTTRPNVQAIFNVGGEPGGLTEDPCARTTGSGVRNWDANAARSTHRVHVIG